jgi:hypothetical protein
LRGVLGAKKEEEKAGKYYKRKVSNFVLLTKHYNTSLSRITRKSKIVNTNIYKYCPARPKIP